MIPTVASGIATGLLAANTGKGIVGGIKGVAKGLQTYKKGQEKKQKQLVSKQKAQEKQALKLQKAQERKTKLEQLQKAQETKQRAVSANQQEAEAKLPNAEQLGAINRINNTTLATNPEFLKTNVQTAVNAPFSQQDYQKQQIAQTALKPQLKANVPDSLVQQIRDKQITRGEAINAITGGNYHSQGRVLKPKNDKTARNQKISKYAPFYPDASTMPGVTGKEQLKNYAKALGEKGKLRQELTKEVPLDKKQVPSMTKDALNRKARFDALMSNIPKGAVPTNVMAKKPKNSKKQRALELQKLLGL